MVNGVLSIPLSGVSTRLPSGSKRMPGPTRSVRSFVAGPENILLTTAYRSVLDRSAVYYSPLVLTGPSGVGKTHFATGLARRWQEEDSQAKVVYVSAEKFAGRLKQAIASNTTSQFRDTFRTADLFVLEELDKLATRQNALGELLHTLDSLQDRVAMVLLTSRKSPQEIEQLSPALRSRLSSGLQIELAMPGIDARQMILQDLAEQYELEMTPTVARSFAELLATNVPELIDAMHALSMTGKDRTLDLAKIRKYLASRIPPELPSTRSIIQATAKHFSLTATQLRGISRNRTIAQARGIAMYVARKITGQSLEKIGMSFGKRDHTTVLYNCRKIEKLIRTDLQTRHAVEEIQRALNV